jgi:hypothetical protein
LQVLLDHNIRSAILDFFKVNTKKGFLMLSDATKLFQPLLIEVQESDDIWLRSQEDILWFHVVKSMPVEPLTKLAAQYYQALYEFNENQAIKNEANRTSQHNTEGQAEATLRLLQSRATESDDVCPLHPLFWQENETSEVNINPAPGVVPIRLYGKTPKCFFAMFKAFVAVSIMGKSAEPENVFHELQNNPAFARTCGFTLPSIDCGYRQSDIPSLRKLEQFDQIMTINNLWNNAAVTQVKRNFETGKIKAESVLVHDTTHYDAHSSMHTAYKEDSNGNVSKKSQSATTKNCQCSDRDSCPHEWILGDDGAGTVTKTGGDQHWAHKASNICLPKQGVLIDAIAMADAASHDSVSIVPQLARVFELYPELKKSTTTLLDDKAADDAGLKRQIEEEFGIKLLTPVNPRGRYPLLSNLPRGIDHITAVGTPICDAQFPFQLIGVRNETDKFIFKAPNDEKGTPVCLKCNLKSDCFRGEKGARTIEIAFEKLPWIDPKFPQNSIRFRKIMAKRTAIERLHKLMKFDYGSGRLTKRGNKSFQATLDKTILAMHLVIDQA